MISGECVLDPKTLELTMTTSNLAEQSRIDALAGCKKPGILCEFPRTLLCIVVVG